MAPTTEWLPRLHEAIAPPLDERTRAILARRRRTAVIRRRRWLIRRMLMMADIVALCAAFAVAEFAFPRAVGDHITRVYEFGLFALSLPVWVLVANLYRLYDKDAEYTHHTTTDEVANVLHLVTVGTWFFFVTLWWSGIAHPEIPKLVTFWGLSVVLVATCRFAARAISRRSLLYLQNTVILGSGATGCLVARKLLQHPEYGINLVGFVNANGGEPRPNGREPDLAHITELGGLDSLPTLVQLFDIERVIVASPAVRQEKVLDLIRQLTDLDVQIDVVPRFFEAFSTSARIHAVEGIPLVGVPPLRLSHLSRITKRIMDIVGSVCGLVLVAPLMTLIAVAIKLETPGPIFFRQIRRGTGESVFTILKFRTMIADAEALKASVTHLNMHAANGGDPRMFKIPEDPRTTSVGKILRRYSLDELPQLINVLKGEMSLVGPRPLILDEDKYVDKWARRRVDLKPGITGLWQVLGRNIIPFEEMTRLDYLYVTNWSLKNDVRLLLRTIPALFHSRHAY